MMELVVFGANGPTGRQVVQQALAAGHSVVAVTRKPDGYPIEAPGLRVVSADVTDPSSVRDAVAGAGAIISTYGVPYSRRRVTVYSEGALNIIAAMHHHGVSRLVCVTSTSIAPGETPGESLFWRKTLIPFLRNVIGRTLYDDMQRMEKTIEGSDLDWTIIRPGGLFDTAHPTADYIVSLERLPGRMTSRADLAQTLILEAVERRHPRSIIEVITRSSLPSAQTFFRETFGSGT
jgi:nucleoside-diphosphate-sugar epimerase